MDDFAQFSMDERVFLLFCALNTCGYDFENNKKDGMHPVRIMARKQLKDRGLSTIPVLKKYFRSLPWSIGRQGGQSEFVVWILHFSDPPELKRKQKDWFGNTSETVFTDLEKVLRKFYFDAEIEQLWSLCIPAYQEEIGKYEETLKKGVRHMVEYMRLRELPSKRIVHIPNLLDSYWTGYGPKIGDDAYVVFGPTIDRLSIGLHEHLHPIIKPMLKKNAGIIRRTGQLYSQIRKKMELAGYDTWDIAVEECLIRALDIRLMERILKTYDPEKSIEQQCNHGFIFVRKFYEKLAAYERSNKTFEEYVPQLLQILI